MPRLHLSPHQLVGGAVTLEADAHRYVTRVLRLAVGDEITVFDGLGTEVEARVVTTSSRQTVLALGARRTVALPVTRITLVQGIARGERMDVIVQKTTELGISRIVPAIAARSLPEPPGEGRVRRWRTIAQEAARQCGRADVPQVEQPVGLAEAISGAGAGRKLVLWEGSSGAPLRSVLTSDGREVALLVGPEGGLTEPEVASARAEGWEVVGLGPRILRTETAAIVAVALVQAATGGLD